MYFVFSWFICSPKFLAIFSISTKSFLISISFFPINAMSSTSAYALHILNNKHDFGTAEDTLKLLKSCHKGTRMNCWETVYMQLFHRHDTLNNEQQVSDINPLYEIADTS
jgi:hypothetical protein